MTEEITTTKSPRLSFNTKQLTQISTLFHRLHEYSVDDRILEIAETIPKFGGDTLLVTRKLEAMGLIEPAVKRHILVDDEIEAVDRAVENLYDALNLASGTPREKSFNIAARQNLAKRVNRDPKLEVADHI